MLLEFHKGIAKHLTIIIAFNKVGPLNCSLDNAAPTFFQENDWKI
jgi:hypothetical protein